MCVSYDLCFFLSHTYISLFLLLLLLLFVNTDYEEGCCFRYRSFCCSHLKQHTERDRPIDKQHIRHTQAFREQPLYPPTLKKVCVSILRRSPFCQKMTGSTPTHTTHSTHLFPLLFVIGTHAYLSFCFKYLFTCLKY